MRKSILLLCIAALLFNCADKKTTESSSDFYTKPPADTVLPAVITAKPKEPKTYPDFRAILDFPQIKDSASFAGDLDKYYDFDKSQCYIHKIKKYRKVRLYGSDSECVIVESGCDFNNVKYQLAIFTDKGKHIKTISGYRYEFIKLFPDKDPVLMNLDVTTQGNGGHEFLAVKKGKLEGLNTLYENFPNTFDAHHDNAVFDPEELKMTIKDDNGDGFNDIIFSGTIILIQYRSPQGDWFDNVTDKNGKAQSYSIEHPFKKAAVKFVLLYDKKTNHFVSKENYEEKYKEYYY